MEERILRLIERDLELLEPHLQKWVKDNLITPQYNYRDGYRWKQNP